MVTGSRSPPKGDVPTAVIEAPKLDIEKRSMTLLDVLRFVNWNTKSRHLPLLAQEAVMPSVGSAYTFSLKFAVNVGVAIVPVVDATTGPAGVMGAGGTDPPTVSNEACASGA